MVETEPMSELKFACPVCGQHITADSSTSGGQIECPTCFQKIVVPQAPASGDSKFILSASQVSKPRPVQNGAASHLGPLQKSPTSVVVPILLILLLLGGAGAAVFLFRDKIFKTTSQQAQPATDVPPKHKEPRTPRAFHPIPTNFSWRLDLTNAALPEAIAAGNVHGSGFVCEKATLQGGASGGRKPDAALVLQLGHAWPPDLGVGVLLFAGQGEELSGKTVEVGPERAPPLPRVVLRWKDDQEKPVTQYFNSGYALKLVFGTAAAGRIPGKIYLCFPDDAKSFVAGTFEAEIRKPPPPKAPRPKTPKPPKPPG
jgi:DNA-directed RNA polymerase subunit RPC12/RpoP